MHNGSANTSYLACTWEHSHTKQTRFKNDGVLLYATFIVGTLVCVCCETACEVLVPTMRVFYTDILYCLTNVHPIQLYLKTQLHYCAVSYNFPLVVNLIDVFLPCSSLFICHYTTTTTSSRTTIAAICHVRLYQQASWVVRGAWVLMLFVV